MITVIQEVIDPQTKIVFSKMSDQSILLRISDSIDFMLNKSDLLDERVKLDITHVSKDQIIEAFERLEDVLIKKRTYPPTELNGFF